MLYDKYYGVPGISNVSEVQKNRFKVVMGPFRSKLGHVVGNSLRRILLSSIPGAAVTEVYINNCLHEYATLEGVQEDVVELLLALKNLAVSLVNDLEEETVTLSKVGGGVLKVSDIEANEHVEFADPNYIIAHLNEDANIDMTLKIKRHYGFVPASIDGVSEGLSKKIGHINLDASFNPVLDVSFKVVNFEKDFDNLIIFVRTKGNIKIEKTIEIALGYLYEQISVFSDLKVPLNTKSEKDDNKIDPTLIKTIEELGLTVRSSNCLKARNIRYLGELVQLPESELIGIPNLGRKSFNEIKEVLSRIGLSLGTIVKNWPPKQLINL